ncbi:MAG TPA: septal ring lytic transglycosylase RlpA family protein [Stellaceae bacterium]|nr:septal ring lytic transglycosylase RlpA family protein [Stellaceae bacterium]
MQLPLGAEVLRRFGPLVLVLCLSACAGAHRVPTSGGPGRATYSETGLASWYGKEHQGRRTANGEPFDMRAMTAAHRSLPFETVVRVTNLNTGKTVKVRINDRGPFLKGRIIDLSAAAARSLGIASDGVAPIRIEAFASDQSGT